MSVTSGARMKPLDRLWVFLATGFGSGFFPFAPATFASLLVTIGYRFLAPQPGPLAIVWVVGIAAVIFAVGIPLSRRTEEILGPDARPIVIDEVAGQLIAFAGLEPSWTVLVAGFLFFRAADIIKVPPAGAAERLKNGLGVMADDLVAGVYAHIALRVFLVLLAWFTRSRM
jgi:phosphatidylglycerophosphatase A